jgi:hypothetical protein
MPVQPETNFPLPMSDVMQWDWTLRCRICGETITYQTQNIPTKPAGIFIDAAVELASIHVCLESMLRGK